MRRTGPLIDRKDLFTLLLIPIVTLAAFWPTLGAQFTSWDDYETVARNPLLLPPTARSLEAFWSRPHGHLYIPATYTAWWGVARLGFHDAQLEPRWFHGLNLATHIVAALLTYAILNRLVRHRPAALVGALLFALHPVQVESVAWVSGFKDVLFGALSLVAIYEYVKFAQDDRRRRLNYIAAITAFVLAMLAKPTAMVLPLVVIVLDAVVIRRPIKDVFRAAWPWLLLAIPCAIAVKAFQPPVQTTDAVAIWARPLVAADAIAFYLYKLVWPATLTIDYGRTPAAVLANRQLAWTWIVPGVVIVIAAYAWRRGVREVAAGLAVMAIVLLPVLGLVPFDFQTYSTVADHYLYFAMLGPALIVAAVLARWPVKAAFAVAGCLFALLGLRTHNQAEHWRGSDSLFQHAASANRQSFVAYNSMATLALEKDDPQKATTLAKRSIDIRPTALAFTTLGESFRRRGELPAAADAYREAIKRDDKFSPALSNLAIMLAEQGQIGDAIPLARRAVEADPYSVPGRVNLGLMYLNAGQGELARAQFEEVLRIDPSNEAVRQQLRQLP